MLCAKIDKAVTIAAREDCPLMLPDIVSHVHYWRTPLVKWMVDQFKTANYDVENQQLRSRVWPLFIGCNSTYHVNEKVFGWMTTQASKNSASVTVADATAHYFAGTCPFVADSGVQVLEVPDSIYQLGRPCYAGAITSLCHRPRHCKQTGLDLSPLTVDSKPGSVKFQRVGVQSYRSQISAVDYILLDADNNFCNSELVWRSRFFLEKLVVHRVGTDEYFESLGPGNLTFLAVRLATWTSTSGSTRYFNSHNSRQDSPMEQLNMSLLIP